MHYYNENDLRAAAWLRQLISRGTIPAGDVDTRSIREVQPSDLAGYTQCHFFAGIGGWSAALQLAGWPADRPVWTGSCPCQPFSSAGQGKGQSDDRHLWPEWFRLIRECRPHVLFGEQVASSIAHGWLDGVCADLEGEGYACGQVVLGAHSVGASHRRQRLWFVAHAESQRLSDGHAGLHGDAREAASHGSEAVCHLSDAQCGGQQGRDPRGADGSGSTLPHGGEGVSVVESDGGRWLARLDAAETARHWESAVSASPWDDYRAVECLDGELRKTPTEPILQPLAYGLPGRVGLLRGPGNAIVPQVAAVFVKAYMSMNEPTAPIGNENPP